MATPEQPNPLIEKTLPHSTPAASHNEDVESTEGYGKTHDWTKKAERDLV